MCDGQDWADELVGNDGFAGGVGKGFLRMRDLPDPLGISATACYPICSAPVSIFSPPPKRHWTKI